MEEAGVSSDLSTDVTTEVSTGDSADALVPLLEELCSAPSWVATRALIEAHPALLRPEAEEFLRWLVSEAEAAGDTVAAALFRDHADVLGHTRTHGFDRALEGMAVSKTDHGRDEDISWFLGVVEELFQRTGWVDVLSFVVHHPILLGPEAESATDLAGEDLSPDERRSVTVVRHLLAQAQRFGPLGALLHGAVRSGRGLADTLRAVLRRHPELLDETVAADVLARLRDPAEATIREPEDTEPDPPLSDVEVEYLAAVLETCREESDPDVALDAVRDSLAEAVAGEALNALVTADDPQAMVAVFATWPTLAGEEALTALAGRMREARRRRDTPYLLTLGIRRDFLVRARTAGAGLAVAELLEEQECRRLLTLAAYLYTENPELRDVLVDGCPMLLAWNRDEIAPIAEQMAPQIGPEAAELLHELAARLGDGPPTGRPADDRSWEYALEAAQWYTERFNDSERRDPAHLHRAAAFCEAALLLAPVDADETVVRTLRLIAAGLFEDLYESGVAPGALHRAIRYREEVLAEPPPDCSRETVLAQLRNDLGRRRAGEADIAREIDVHGAWRDLAPPGSTERWVRGANLGELMVEAVRQYTRVDLIDPALRLYEELRGTEPPELASGGLSDGEESFDRAAFRERATEQ
ncbi:hypothetical protein, partial [Streptomyces sp. KR55]|uniref:hypothetical protein n=1 Tax=Streptomyces sp. KR55 TaxID=3457425 RepID=UPI003FCF1890